MSLLGFGAFLFLAAKAQPQREVRLPEPIGSSSEQYCLERGLDKERSFENNLGAEHFFENNWVEGVRELDGPACYNLILPLSYDAVQAQPNGYHPLDVSKLMVGELEAVRTAIQAEYLPNRSNSKHQ